MEHCLERCRGASFCALRHRWIRTCSGKLSMGLAEIHVTGKLVVAQCWQHGLPVSQTDPLLSLIARMVQRLVTESSSRTTRSLTDSTSA
jgi:hypothetical protein